ncbi:MAG: ExbD/TolR family protein [Planctomycetota bacterium]|jgi:biopolymer transport protein ExbD
MASDYQEQLVVEEMTVHFEPPRKRRQESKKMQPPLTPMIDVTFQLLLFFLLSFTFRDVEGEIPGTLPKKGAGGVSARDTLTQPIRINLIPTGAAREGVLYEIEGVNEQVTDAKTLYQVLLRRQQILNSKEGPVIIKPDAFVRWQYVVEVFNQAVRLQFKNIGFAPVS